MSTITADITPATYMTQKYISNWALQTAYVLYIYTACAKVWGRYDMEALYAHQGYIKNTVKTLIFWNIITI